MPEQTITLTPGRLRHGHWCDTCALSSAVATDVYHLCADHGPHYSATVTYCPDCGEWEWSRPDEP